MWKKLAILAVLLAITQAPVPGLGQTPNHGNHHVSNPPKKANSEQQSAQPKITFVVGKDCESNQFKNDPDCKAAKDKENTIFVGKLPTANVTIQQIPKRDWLDLVACVANIGLFLVGFVGILIAVVTVRTVKRQVDTFVSKERARLTVDIDPFQPDGPNSLGNRYPNSNSPPASKDFWIAKLKIANHGSTNALIGSALCLACVEHNGWDAKETAIMSQIPLPTVIPPDGKVIEFDARIEINKKHEWKVDRPIIDAVANGSRRIYVIGLIEYSDVFETHRTLKFFRQWYGTWFENAWQFTSWRNYGPDDGGPIDGNREFRIEKPSKMLRIWRRLRKCDPDELVITITN
jgi:preprotein translocase subunit Sss1